MPLGRTVHQIIWLGNDEEVPAAAGKIAVGEGAARGALRGGTVAQLFGTIDLGDAGNGSNGVEKSFHGVRIGGELFVYALRKVHVADVDACNRGLVTVETLERFFDLLLHLWHMKDAGIGACELHVFGNGHNAVIGRKCDNVVASPYFLVKIFEKIAKIVVEAF